MKKYFLLLILIFSINLLYAQKAKTKAEKVPVYAGTVKIIGAFSSDGGGALGVDFKFTPYNKKQVPAEITKKFFTYIENNDDNPVHTGKVFTCTVQKIKGSYTLKILLPKKESISLAMN